MKIGLLTAHALRRAAGVWVSVAQLGKALAARGLDVEIFGIADDRGETDGVGWDGPPLNLHSARGSERFGYAPRLARALHGRCPSLLHANGLWMYPSLASLRWSRRARRPYLISPHGMLDPWAVRNAAWKKRLVGRWFEDAHLAGAACLHAVTEAEAHAIRAYGLRNPICVVPNGVDLPSETVFARPAWLGASEKDRRIVLFLGRLHPKKGLENLLAAWRDVQSSPGASDWLLVIAGWDQGGHERQLRRIAEEHGIDRSLRFVGPQFDRDKAASFACADAFVLPSLSEGLPVAVLEAWSYGLPVLMTEACNLPEGFATGAALPLVPALIPAGDDEQPVARARARLDVPPRREQVLQALLRMQTPEEEDDPAILLRCPQPCRSGRCSPLRQINAVGDDADRIGQAVRPDRTGLRCRQGVQAGGARKVRVLEPPADQPLLPGRIADGPGVEHAARGDQVGTARAPAPAEAHERGIHPKAVRVEERGAPIMQRARQARGVAECVGADHVVQAKRRPLPCGAIGCGRGVGKAEHLDLQTALGKSPA